jgi:glyoxylase-like metal-dependent hydrolase (beta-lactamase superfamily II)
MLLLMVENGIIHSNGPSRAVRASRTSSWRGPLRNVADSGKPCRMSALPPVKKFVSNTGVRIYRIPCQVFEGLSARVYLLLGAGPPTLVDAGSGQGESTRQILAGIDSVRTRFGEPVRAGDINRIILSHCHIDHVDGLPELLPHTSAQVAIHPLDRRAVVSRREYMVVGDSRLGTFFQEAGVDPARRRQLLQASHLNRNPIESVPIALSLADGEELDGLRIIHTPGHSAGHVCIAVGNILLSADHILAQTVPQQWPESMAAYTGIGHYLESLDKIARIPGFELTLAAHEQAIHDVYARIVTIRGAHKRRLDRLLETLRKLRQPLSVDDITRHLYPEISGFRAFLAVTDVGSRVEYLHQRGQLIVANLDDVERQQTPVYQYVAV